MDKLKKVIDYILVEKYVQYFMKDCSVDGTIGFCTDHNLVIAKLNTPTTKVSRKIQKNNNMQVQKLDIKALDETEIRTKFVEAVKNAVVENRDMNIENRSKALLSVMLTAAQSTLPKSKPKNDNKQIWKNDTQLNNLLNQREHLIRTSNAFKLCTKEIKKRVKFLNNQKALKEANSINEYATTRPTTAH